MLSRNSVGEYFKNQDAIQVANQMQLTDILQDQAAYQSELKNSKKTEFHQGVVLHEEKRN